MQMHVTFKPHDDSAIMDVRHSDYSKVSQRSQRSNLIYPWVQPTPQAGNSLRADSRFVCAQQPAASDRRRASRKVQSVLIVETSRQHWQAYVGGNARSGSSLKADQGKI